ncbi:MAG: RNA pseudouridine synthase, partial [Mesorhizobium sp.]
LRSKVKAFPRQALHARLLAFRHPDTHLTMRFEAPIPWDMEELVDGFRKL